MGILNGWKICVVDRRKSLEVRKMVWRIIDKASEVLEKKELKIKIPTAKDFFSRDFGRHLLKAYKEFLLAVTSIPYGHVKKIEEFEKQIEEKKKE